MPLSSFRSVSVWLFLAVVLLPGAAQGQTFEPLAAFEAPPREPRGTPLEIANGVFLGTSEFGGAFDKGTIYVLFRRTDGTWGTFVVHSFYGLEGGRPRAGLIRASDGNYYGTTAANGAHGAGTVYRLSPAGRVTVVHHFAAVSVDGGGPHAPVVEAADGSLWGTTHNGGPTNSGTIFRLTKSGAFTQMYAFGGHEGSTPAAGLVVGADGNFYGTTRWGGTNQYGGTVFRITPAGALTKLHDFHDSPGPLIAGGDGHFYGATEGQAWHGRIFRLTAAGALTVLYNFETATDAVVRNPRGPLVRLPDGTLYGTALFNTHPEVDQQGGVFRLAPDGSVARIAVLGGVLGIYPESGLRLASDGFLYGANAFSRANTNDNPSVGFGTVFRLPLSGPASLVAPMSTGGPVNPYGTLTEGPDGRLYGATCAGGAYNFGTIYRLEPSNAVTVVHSFERWDGWCPNGLTLGPDGAFYGAARGHMGLSALFRITTSGTLTKLWELQPGIGKSPAGPPTFGADGNLYLVIAETFGGSGEVIRVTPAGAGTSLAGAAPFGVTGSLVLGTDGHLYGIAASAPSMLYRLSLDGTFTTVSTFPTELGVSLGPVQGLDGRMYAAGAARGSSGAGVIASAALTGNGTIEHEFSFADGANVLTRLLETAPQKFTGVTTGYQDLTYGLLGTVFTLDTPGSLTTVHRFAWWDGAHPYGGLTRASDGGLYGTTYRGGWLGGGGVIYRIVPPAAR
jgi:uncharacterized repeat protein (TIGR03803 family)